MFFKFLFFQALSIPTVVIACMMALVHYGMQRQKYNKEFKRRIKTKYLPQILEEFEEIKWRGHDDKRNSFGCMVSDEELEASGLFMHFNKRCVDDEFRGKYKNTSFRISETSMYYESGTSRYRTNIQILNGLAIVFELDKKVKNRTIITPKKAKNQRNNAILIPIAMAPFMIEFVIKKFALWKLIAALIMLLIGYIIALCFHKKTTEPLDKVTLEDPHFEKLFNVYSSDQVEARYFVTPAFMERICNFKNSLGANEIRCSFYGQSLLIAMDTNRNLFEIGSLFKPFNDPGVIRKFQNEIKAIYDLIDYFKINN